MVNDYSINLQTTGNVPANFLSDLLSEYAGGLAENEESERMLSLVEDIEFLATKYNAPRPCAFISPMSFRQEFGLWVQYADWLDKIGRVDCGNDAVDSDLGLAARNELKKFDYALQNMNRFIEDYASSMAR